MFSCILSQHCFPLRKLRKKQVSCLAGAAKARARYLPAHCVGARSRSEHHLGSNKLKIREK